MIVLGPKWKVLFHSLPASASHKAAAWISADPDFPLLRVGCFLTHSVRGRGGQKVEAATEQQGPPGEKLCELKPEVPGGRREQGKRMEGPARPAQIRISHSPSFSLFLSAGHRGSPTMCLLTVKEPMPSAGPSHH